jgi:hypothetical protein
LNRPVNRIFFFMLLIAAVPVVNLIRLAIGGESVDAIA